MPTRELTPDLQALNSISRDRWAVAAAVAIVKACDYADGQLGVPSNTTVSVLIKDGKKKFKSSPAVLAMRKAQDFTDANMSAIFDAIVRLSKTGTSVEQLPNA